MTQPPMDTFHADLLRELHSHHLDYTVDRQHHEVHVEWAGPNDNTWRLAAQAVELLTGTISVVISTSAHLTVTDAEPVIATLRGLGAIPEPSPATDDWLPVGEDSVTTTPAVDPAREELLELSARLMSIAKTLPPSTPPDPELTVDEYGFTPQLLRLREGLAVRGFQVLEDGWGSGWLIDRALQIADQLKQEYARIEMMADQRGRIIDLCICANEVTPMRPADGPKAWTLDPAAVRDALTYKPAEPRGPLSREEEIIHALHWEGTRLLTEDPTQFTPTDQAQLQLLHYAREADDAAWVLAFVEMITTELDEDDQAELDDIITRWRGATSTTTDATAPAPIDTTTTTTPISNPTQPTPDTDAMNAPSGAVDCA